MDKKLRDTTILGIEIMIIKGRTITTSKGETCHVVQIRFCRLR